MRSLHPNKIFTVLCCIKYISNIISPDSNLKMNILSIMGDGGNLLNLQEMGFPRNWKLLGVWKEIEGRLLPTLGDARLVKPQQLRKT